MLETDCGYTLQRLGVVARKMPSLRKLFLSEEKMVGKIVEKAEDSDAAISEDAKWFLASVLGEASATLRCGMIRAIFGWAPLSSGLLLHLRKNESSQRKAYLRRLESSIPPSRVSPSFSPRPMQWTQCLTSLGLSTLIPKESGRETSLCKEMPLLRHVLRPFMR